LRIIIGDASQAAGPQAHGISTGDSGLATQALPAVPDRAQNRQRIAGLNHSRN